MAISIRNSILDTLLCNSCYKSLSATPVVVFPNRKIKCVRCVTNELQVQFQCITQSLKEVYLFDGCQELLSTSQVVRHEETCKPKYYNCPVCAEGVPTYLMINHFETKHKQLLLKSNQFIIKQLDETLLKLHYEERTIFLLNGFENVFPNAEVLSGSTVSVTIENKKALVQFSCSKCDRAPRNSLYFIEMDTAYYEICGLCSRMLSEPIVKFDGIMSYVLFSCKWKCGKYYNHNAIGTHEKFCEKQISQHCPMESCKFKCKLFEIEQHFKEQHHQLPLPIFVSLATLFRDYYYYAKLSLNCSSNKKQLIVYSHIYIFVDFIWEQSSFWKIMITCKLPNARPRVVIFDQSMNIKTIIKRSGIIPHSDTIYLCCDLLT